MITENYVSFETAKLLKEKGFDAKCDYLYVDGELVRARGWACNWNQGETLFTDYKNECSAPTLQMAMKWLREEHNIFIRIIQSHIEYCSCEIYYNKVQYYQFRESFNSYEEAADAAIKYCLENLI